ncbi:MAG: PfaD family polyunsaturated fatty acid/polyketide biosynthesis protein [Verrucomicrobia bacterium]|nr:PfaD family polyunsaturated fatty acid/polyketide biosynthesis protein [Verrucomicrobiota bacterium]
MPGKRQIAPDRLGSSHFRRRHRLRYSYVAGSMYKGIASKELVVRMGKAGLLGFLGSGGLTLNRLEGDVRFIQTELGEQGVFGVNLLASPMLPELEEATVDLLLRYKVGRVEAAAFTQMTPALVRYRVSGLSSIPGDSAGSPACVLAKVSRPEVAEQFLRPPPAPIISQLVQSGKITSRQAELAQQIPMADDICVEADSGGHTDRGVLHALLPAMRRIRDEYSEKFAFSAPICVGAAGGLGTPEAIAAAFILGADFVLTGSINQCTVEAGTSDTVKDLLQEANVQDTDVVPAGDAFEMGGKVQVFRKGLLFPARAKKLYELYRQFDSLDQIDAQTRTQIETRYFKRSFAEVYAETREYYERVMPEAIKRAERDPKHKMALVFRWYLIHTNRLALRGDPAHKVDYQIHCGPALGAFNQWVRGTVNENWRNRHVDQIAEKLMIEAAAVLEDRLHQLASLPEPDSTTRPEPTPFYAVG